MQTLATTLVAALAALAVSSPAVAEIVEQREDGYRLRNEATVPGATVARVYGAIGEVARWWESSHTFSGDAANMSLALEPGGCFCEALPGGGVEHGRVIFASPDRGVVRILGAFGPLQSEGVSAVLTFTAEPVEGGVRIVQTYNVGGAAPATVEWAGAVDGVMRAQLEGLARHVEARTAD